MVKKIRIIRTMVLEYAPNEEVYPEGTSIEEMAIMDINSDDIELLFLDELKEDSCIFEIFDEE